MSTPWGIFFQIMCASQKFYVHSRTAHDMARQIWTKLITSSKHIHTSINQNHPLLNPILLNIFSLQTIHIYQTHLVIKIRYVLGSVSVISIYAYFWPLWCCNSICHEVINSIQIRPCHTVCQFHLKYIYVPTYRPAASPWPEIGRVRGHLYIT